MEVIYMENPLNTKVLLDENDKKELWYKVKIRELEDLLFEAHFHLQDDYYNIETVKSAVNPVFYMNEEDDQKTNVDTNTDSWVATLIEALQEPHCGDCICVPATCTKCMAEDLLGINTIKNLDKYAACYIGAAFKDGRDIHQVIDYLKHHKPTADWEGWEQWADKWEADYRRAAHWLEQYALKQHTVFD